MTHDCSFGDIKPDLTFILNLSETIDKTIFNLDRIGPKDTSHGSNRIQYIQSEITEILPKVALIPISSFCQFAERDIKNELDIDASELLDFANKIYWENLFPRYEKPVSLEIVDEDYDKEPFCNRLRAESIEMPESMFPPVGSFPTMNLTQIAQ